MMLKGKILILCYGLVFLQITTNAQSPARWSLMQCIDSAIVNNLNLRLSVNTIELSRINLKQSKNNLLPAINGSLGESLSIGKIADPVTGAYENGTVWSTNAGLGFSQVLFNGLQYLNTIKQNQLIYQSSKFDLEDVKFNLTISVVNDFLQVLYAAEAIKIAQNQISADSAQLRKTADLIYVGKKTETDGLQIKSQLTSDKYVLVNAESQWKLAKVNLQQLINIPVSMSFDIDYITGAETLQLQLDDINGIYFQSLAFQPIIKSFALKSQSADWGLRAAKGGYYPQLLLKGNVGTGYSSYAKQANTTTTSTFQNIGYVQSNPAEVVVSNVPQQITKLSAYPFGNQLGDNVNGGLSLGLSIPVLNYLQVRNNVKKQRVNISNAQLNEELIKVNLRKTIEQVYTSAQNSVAQYNSAREEVEANKSAYESAIDNFEQGKMIASDLIVQKNAYVKALSDLLQAKYGLMFNTKILDYYKGVPITF